MLGSCPVNSFAQGRGAASNGSDVSIDPRSAEIHRVIDRSTGYFASGEANFKDGNFEKARREYDRSIDIVLESGIDVRSDARLQQHYQALVDNVFRRQMTLLSAMPSPANIVANNNVAINDNPQQPAPKTSPSTQNQTDKQAQDRGFGQQTFTPSPLDELAKKKRPRALAKPRSKRQWLPPSSTSTSNRTR
jgi:hypothetical protein